MQEMLTSMAKTVRQPIVEEIRRCGGYSVLLDETCDVTVTKQLIIYIRYLDDNSEVRIGM